MAKAKRKTHDLWIIEFRSIDPSRDATVAYESRAEAIKVAINFIQNNAKDELERFEFEPGDEAEELLRNILRDLEAGKVEDAIMGWLDYQGEFEPDEKFAIGPSGSVSNSPMDFPVK